MPNQRSKDKKSIGCYVTEAEKAALMAAAKKAGYKSLTDFLRAIATDAIKVSPKIKTLALAALGNEQGGGGCLGLFVALLGTLAYLVS